MKAIEILVRGCEEMNLTLNSRQQELFEVYLRELQGWSQVLNLTALSGEKEIVTKHFLDSLSCLLCHKIKNGLRAADIGTGAGLPGIPLKIVKPGIKLVLLDSSKKRMKFLAHVTKLMQLELDLVSLRAEEFGRGPGRNLFDLVLARAVSSLPVVLEYAMPLLKTGGYLIAQKGPKITEEIRASHVASGLLGGEVEEIKELKVPFLEARRYLAVVKKVTLTPERYPRRAGIPVKRPLGVVR